MTSTVAAGSAILALALAAHAADAASPPVLRPQAGERLYRYEVREVRPGATEGYSMDYRLRTEPGGGVVAVILRAETVAGETRTPVRLDPACATALHAEPGELAEVRLHPLTPELAKLGEAFLALCAPPALFFPLTDILNVTLIQASDVFHIDRLGPKTRTAAFAGFSTHLRRPGIEMTESSDGGQISLADPVAGRVLVDWAPTLSRLELIQGDSATPGGPVALNGTERFAFRLEIDPRSGVLEHAYALHDDLDLQMTPPGAAQPLRLQVRREVDIRRLPSP
ncbi:MAG: hypothetical protein E7812_01315 [Phenylobacterium sp.]|nr:MAG: hypothetical protein E7812_01315 [Phenylobacterium sp.]